MHAVPDTSGEHACQQQAVTWRWSAKTCREHTTGPMHKQHASKHEETTAHPDCGSPCVPRPARHAHLSCMQASSQRAAQLHPLPQASPRFFEVLALQVVTGLYIQIFSRELQMQAAA